jgi:phosphoribosyl-dephospho-CoA transferase
MDQDQMSNINDSNNNSDIRDNCNNDKIHCNISKYSNISTNSIDGYFRHDMLWLSDKGHEYALQAAERLNPGLSPEQLRMLLTRDLPAIVKLQENPTRGFVEVGFSTHLRENGGRVRIKSQTPTSEIADSVTPFDAIGCFCGHERLSAVLSRIVELAGDCGLTAGLFGSCALELLTNLPYISGDSDADILIKRGKPGAVNAAGFYRAATELSRQYSVRLDIEARCADGSGVKLAELVSGGSLLLHKGLYGAELRKSADFIF